jgi:hypothetical protein
MPRPRVLIAATAVATAVLLAAVVVAARSEPSSRFELEPTLAAQLAGKRGETGVDLTVVPFRWSRVYFFPPYTSAEEIERRLGRRWDEADRAAPLTDWQQSIVFTAGGDVVAWSDVSPEVVSFSCVARPTGYARSQRFVARIGRAGADNVLHRRTDSRLPCD